MAGYVSGYLIVAADWNIGLNFEFFGARPRSKRRVGEFFSAGKKLQWRCVRFAAGGVFFCKNFFARRCKSNAELRNCVAMAGASSSRRLRRKPLELEGDSQIPPHFLFKLCAALAARIWRFLRLKKTLKVSGRAEGIRTPDPLVPNQMRYQTALPPALCRPLRGPGIVAKKQTICGHL